MMRKVRYILIGLLGGIAGVPAYAQPTPPVPANLVIQAMQSQPPVDVSGPVRVTAEFDPPVVAVGEKAIYRISVEALESAVVWPQISVPAGLQFKPEAQGQVLQNTGRGVRPLTAANFHAVAEHAGIFPMPVFFLEVNGNPVLVPEAVLQVVEKTNVTHPPAHRLILRPASTNVYLGDRMTVFTYLPASGSNKVEGLTLLQFSGGGFMESKSDFRQSIKPMELEGRTLPTYVGESHLTAIATGPQTLSAQAFTCGPQFSGPITITGGGLVLGGIPSYVLVESDPVTINVRPLPPENKLSGFTGFIGNLTVDEPRISTNVLQIGDALRLTVTVHSDDSLARLTPPPPPQVANWELFPPEFVEAPTNASLGGGKSQVTFAYTMIPLSADVDRTPVIPFSIFDSEKAAYEDRSIAAVKLKVIGEGPPIEAQYGNVFADEAGEKQPLALSKPATVPGNTVASLVPLQLRPWFFAVQLAPGFAFLTLWLWDRRRRFLEAHPEVVRCQQARRALRRERRALQRAVNAGDEYGFVTRAVSALQIAAAPNFPAAPRALVCGDILSLFDESERQGRTGEVIRSFFSQDGMASFAAEGRAANSLLSLQPELEAILLKMEARL